MLTSTDSVTSHTRLACVFLAFNYHSVMRRLIGNVSRKDGLAGCPETVRRQARRSPVARRSALPWIVIVSGRKSMYLCNAIEIDHRTRVNSIVVC